MDMRINWQYYPRTNKIDSTSKDIVTQFEITIDQIASQNHDGDNLKSNNVLSIVSDGLIGLGFKVETDKKHKIAIPVLFGKNGTVEKSFEVDAFSEESKYVIEIEAGRGVANNQFLKDFFEACVMVDIDYLCIAVRNEYYVNSNGKRLTSHDFDRTSKFFDTLYSSSKFKVPLKGLLLVGY